MLPRNLTLPALFATRMLQGWHRGERAIQRKLGFDGPMAMAYNYIEPELSEEVQRFHSTRLPFIPITTLDDKGRPWTCMFAGASGQPGFVSSPNWERLDMEIRVWDGDPFKDNVNLFGSKDKLLMAGIGIDFSSRLRNKFAGYISDVRKHGDSYQIKTTINQALGNCPKYINIREFVPHPDTHPTVVHKVTRLTYDDRLPEEVIAFVHAADTVFVGTTYTALKADETKFPSHLGQNQRGGRPGFVRVRPSDGKTLVLPDYSGNRFMTSLGNIEATPMAGLTFVDFVTGDILYITGMARTLLGAESHEIMPRQNVITLVTTTGYTFVRDGLPVRQRPRTKVGRSPYSPPIRLLAEETAAASTAYFDNTIQLTLSSVNLHSKDLATFVWSTSRSVHILPGQAAILDFTPLLGSQQYEHMAPWKPNSINDDRIRTWTVSSAHLEPEGTMSFALTMREKPRGMVTGALFSMIRKMAEMRPELLQDTRPLELQVNLVGVAGEFKLSVPDQKVTPGPMLWIAGGIGVTPFLSMLRAIVRSDNRDISWDVVLALSTREPEVLIPLVEAALESEDGPTSKLRLRVDVFSSKPVPSLPPSCRTGNLDVSFAAHEGRISQQYVSNLGSLDEYTAYVCGPEGFERSVLDLLKERGYSKAVVRESFEY